MGTELFGVGKHRSARTAATVVTDSPLPRAQSWLGEGKEGLLIHPPAQPIAANCHHGSIALSPRKRKTG